MTIVNIIHLPENYRHDHFTLNVRIKDDLKELQDAVSTLREPTAELKDAVEAETKTAS